MIETIETTPPKRGHDHLLERMKKIMAAPWLHFALAGVFVALDQFSGPLIHFPATFVIPVALAAWYGSRRNAMLLALGQPVVNLAVTFLAQSDLHGVPPAMMVINAAIRAIVLALLAYFISKTSAQNRELARRVGLLRGEIPVCICCQKAQDEQQQWLPLPIYIARHTAVNFTDGLCPDCKKSALS